MGQSNSIQEQAKKNAEFEAYLKQMESDLDARATKAWDEINQDITQHYSKFGNDSFELVKDDKKHLTTLSEWSLDSVNKMIDSIQNQIFGKSKSTPNGNKTISDEEKSKPEVSQAIEEMSNIKLLIAKTVFLSIQGILESFASKTSTELMYERKIVPLSPGLTLFICIIENSVQESRFFSNELICQNFYLYTARYSITEGKNLVNFNHLQALAELEAAYDSQERKIANAMANLDPTGDKYEEQQVKYDRIMKNIENNRQEITKKMEEIKAS